MPWIFGLQNAIKDRALKPEAYENATHTTVIIVINENPYNLLMPILINFKYLIEVLDFSQI